MIDLWNARPGEDHFSLTWLAGATRNPIDNALIAWLRPKWEESRSSDDRQTQG